MVYSRHRMYGSSFGGRRSGNSNPCAGLVVGFMLFVAAFPTIWWNEGRSVDVFATLNSLEQNPRTVDADDQGSISDAGRSGELVFLNDIVQGERIYDESLGVDIPNAVSLRRKSQMYQWQEKMTKRRSGSGSSNSQVATYSYQKVWSERIIDSSRFAESHHQNPTYMPVENQEWIARKASVGKVSLSTSIIKGINEYHPLPLQPAIGDDRGQDKVSTALAPITTPTNLPKGYSVESGLVVNRAGALYQPNVGDVKVEYRFVPGGVPISVLGKMTSKGVLEPVRTRRGTVLPMVKLGDHTASELIAFSIQENSMQTWLLRGAGFLMLLLGLLLIFSPLTNLIGHIWIVGSIVNLGIFFAAFLVSLACWSTTFALAWLFYRPVISVTGLAIAAASIFPIFNARRKA